nr:BadF/BadG/BcrA/BcrD ATPase family protein [Candidatus Prometheoarchaeum syntrophicum]
MYTVGIDIGSLATKIVLLSEGKIIAMIQNRSLHNFSAIGTQLFNQILEENNLTNGDIGNIYSTGYGRHSIPNLTSNIVTEISAHARGAQYFHPKVQSIIDIGGQDSKVIKINPKSLKVIDFQMNDKCAAGTGRFLEVMANALDIPIEDLGNLALESNSPVQISSTCTVFAESEVIGQFAQGAAKHDIAAGIHNSIAKRIASMAKRIQGVEPIVFCGGVALNPAVKIALENELKLKLIVPKYPQYTGAIGAALIAKEKFKNGSKIL